MPLSSNDTIGAASGLANMVVPGSGAIIGLGSQLGKKLGSLGRKGKKKRGHISLQLAKDVPVIAQQRAAPCGFFCQIGNFFRTLFS